MKLIDIYRVINKFSKIIIYGAGGVGQSLYEYLMDNQISIDKFVITCSDTPNRVQGVPVISIQEVSQNEKENALFVIAAKNPNGSEMVRNARKHNICNILFLDDGLIEEIEKWKEKRLKIRNQSLLSINRNVRFENKRILVVAPHPDDESIGCGGLLTIYHDNVDVLCINSSGVWYTWEVQNAEKIADIRINEFYNTMKFAGINKSFIGRIWGVPPMFNGIEKNLANYKKHFDYSIYDYVFLPHPDDNHREHRYLTKFLFKKIIEEEKLKDDLQIAFYEVWAPMSNPNFFLDITSVVSDKDKLINLYESRKKGRYAERMKALNFYRGIQAQMEYAEAYSIIPLQEYIDTDYYDDWSLEI